MYSLMGLSKRLYPAGRREEGMEHFTPARFSSGLPTMTPYPGQPLISFLSAQRSFIFKRHSSRSAVCAQGTVCRFTHVAA